MVHQRSKGWRKDVGIGDIGFHGDSGLNSKFGSFGLILSFLVGLLVCSVLSFGLAHHQAWVSKFQQHVGEFLTIELRGLYLVLLSKWATFILALATSFQSLYLLIVPLDNLP
jgi:hypothetical protein